MTRLGILGLAGLMCTTGCRDDATANATKVEEPIVQSKQGRRRKKGDPGVRQSPAAREGHVELAAFAKELEEAVLAGNIDWVRQRFLEPDQLGNCEVMRVRTKEHIGLPQMRMRVAENRDALNATFLPTPGKVLAVTHKVRPKKRFMGGRIDGEDCPVRSRGRVNVVMGPPAAPPDAIENRFETLFLGGEWLIFAYDRIERDCSIDAEKDTYGCRVLGSGEP